MEKQTLIDLIDKGFTVQKIADHQDCSFTNVRYWLRKYGLNTKTYSRITGQVCKVCDGILKGRQTMYCSPACKVKAHEHISRVYTNQQKRGWERKKELVTICGGKCNRCGYSKNYSGLTFHHIHPKEKSFNLDVRHLSNRSWDEIVKEANKCELLCHNCHAEHHNPNHAIKQPQNVSVPPAST